MEGHIVVAIRATEISHRQVHRPSANNHTLGYSIAGAGNFRCNNVYAIRDAHGEARHALHSTVIGFRVSIARNSHRGFSLGDGEGTVGNGEVHIIVGVGAAEIGSRECQGIGTHVGTRGGGIA